MPKERTPSDVPDVLAPDLDVVFCGINPGRVSAEARAHFANPRNDFWRLLHDAGFTPRLYESQEQFALPELGVGLTNAAYRTTPGSGDLRRGDFADSARRLERLARELRPRAIAFVGKEAYRGAFGVRPEFGVQPRILVDTGLFVLPSTSPANAAVPYAERLHWFRALRAWLDEPVRDRRAVRALVLDSNGRTLLLRWPRPGGSPFWIAPGGGVEPGESDEQALRRERAAAGAGRRRDLAAPAVRDRRAAVAAERLRSQPHARGRLAALVLGAVDHRDRALDELGIEAVGRELLARAVELDVRLEDPVEHVVRRQRVLVELVRAQLGARRPVDRRLRDQLASGAL